MARTMPANHPGRKKAGRKTAGGSTANRSHTQSGRSTTSRMTASAGSSRTGSSRTSPADGRAPANNSKRTPREAVAGGNGANSNGTTPPPTVPVSVVTAHKPEMRMSLSTASSSSTPTSSRQGGGPNLTTTPREGIADPSLNKFKMLTNFKDKCEDWNDSITRNVPKYFNGIQFLVHGSDEKFGSPWQRVLCTNAEVPEIQQEEYWNRSLGGMVTARRCLNRRRMNIAGQMRAKFMS